MLSIGEFSKVCMVSVKTLHHYDKIGLLHPDFVDDWTGYRYYSESSIPTMLFIRRCKQYGFSLSQIRQLLEEKDSAKLCLCFRQQRRALLAKRKELDEAVLELDRHLKNYERTGEIMGYQKDYEIVYENTQDRYILSSRQHMAVTEFGFYYGKLFERIAREGICVGGKTLAIYHDEEFNRDSSDIEVAIEVLHEKDATRVLPGGLCATTRHHGAYSSLPEAYGALMQWIEQEGYVLKGAPYEIYVKTQFDDLPPQDWETQIFFPIQKKK